MPYISDLSKNAIEWLKEIAQKNKSIFIKIEPLKDVTVSFLIDQGFLHSNKNINPHKTVIIDITKSDQEILTQMHHKTRYNLKVAQKNDIVVEQSNDIDVFWKLMSSTIDRKQIHYYDKKYFEKMFEFFRDDEDFHVDLFLASHNKKPISAVLIMKHGDTAYYLHGGNDYEYRNLMAPYILHWEIILQLKADGVQLYDLWGIDAQKYPGVTRFKLGWIGGLPNEASANAGKMIEYPGSFDLPISKFWYFLYKIK